MREPDFRSVLCPASWSRHKVKENSRVDDDVGKRDGDQSQHEITTVVFETYLDRVRSQCLFVQPFRVGRRNVSTLSEVTLVS